MMLGLCAVTGGCGWFASFLINDLVSSGHNVIAVDIIKNVHNKSKNIKYMQCDITNTDEMIATLKNVETVFHVCSIQDIRKCAGGSHSTSYNVNVNGTTSLITASIACNVKRIIYTSSVGVTVDGKPKYLQTEDYPINIKYISETTYAQTKYLAEQIILKAEENHKTISVAIIRLPILYGPKDPLIEARNGCVGLGDMKCKSSFIYIENAAYAHRKCAEALKNETDTINRQIFNIKDFDYSTMRLIREWLNEEIDKADFRFCLPATFALFLAWMNDWITLICYWIFGIKLGHPLVHLCCFAMECGVLVYVLICQRQFGFQTKKFEKIVGYCPPFSRDESKQKTINWWNTYKSTKQKKKALCL
eukprot:132713_1